MIVGLITPLTVSVEVAPGSVKVLPTVSVMAGLPSKVMTGGVVSCITTSDVVPALLPAVSVAVHVTLE